MKQIIEYQGKTLSQPEILKKVIQQLNKDIAMCGWEDSFEENSNPEKLMTELEDWVVSKLEKDDRQLMNFLYRVDVAQSKIFSGDGLPQKNFVKQVLMRELQKVVLRQQFSSDDDNLKLK